MMELGYFTAWLKPCPFKTLPYKRSFKRFEASGGAVSCDAEVGPHGKARIGGCRFSGVPQFRIRSAEIFQQLAGECGSTEGG
jgi:hypothetical protein